MAEIRTIIGRMKGYAEAFQEIAKAIRDTDPKQSYTDFQLSETCRQAAEELERLVPVPPDMESGGSNWFWTCGECHGYITRTDGFCNHCGKPVEWS